MKFNLLNKGCLTLVLTAVALIVMSMPLYSAENNQDMDMAAHDYILDKQQSYNCSMVQMNDEELSEVTAAGFSNFNLTDDVTKAYFNVEAQTFTEIQSLKMGYYNNGWDEDWTNVSLGSSTQDLICKGLYIEAGFSNISTSSTRTLDSFKVGASSMTGPISATFNSFSGRIEDRETTPGTVLVPVEGQRLNLGTKTITATNSEFSMQLSNVSTTTPAGVTTPTGWYFYWSNAKIN
jgi:hypothetical protein